MDEINNSAAVHEEPAFTIDGEILDAAWNEEEAINAEPETPGDMPPKPETLGDMPPEPETPQSDKEPAEEEHTAAEAPATAPEPFVLKYRHQDVSVTLDEMKNLAQKGMDYERVKARLEEAEPILAQAAEHSEQADFVRWLAEQDGTSPAVLMENARAQVLSRKEGLDIETALQRVRLDRDRRELEKRASGALARELELERQRQQTEARAAEMREFLSQHPDVDFKAIPQETWKPVAEGKMSIASAYALYESSQSKQEITKLKEQIAAMEKNSRNVEKAAGSVASAGEDKKASNFDRYWYEED